MSSGTTVRRRPWKSRPASSPQPCENFMDDSTNLTVASGENTGATTAAATPSTPKAPKQLWIDELNASTFNELLQRAEDLNVRVNPEKTRHHIVFDLLRAYAALGTELFADG